MLSLSPWCVPFTGRSARKRRQQGRCLVANHGVLARPKRMEDMEDSCDGPNIWCEKTRRCWCPKVEPPLEPGPSTLGLRQKKLAETHKLETMYSSLLEKFNDEETVFEENISSPNCSFQQALVQIKSHLTNCLSFSSIEG